MSVFELVVRMRTSTPRFTALISRSQKSSLGTKYELLTYSVFDAPAIERARKRSAGVLPNVGRLCIRPALTLPPSANAIGGKRSEERRVGKECRSRWSPE